MSTNQYPGESQQPKKSGAGGCLKAAGIGCGVLILVAIVLGIWGYNMMMKNPTTRNVFQQSQTMGVCAGNIQLIGKSLNQYSADHGGKYPATLDDLYPKYITDRSKFVCPLAGTVRYEYKQPAPSAPDTTIVLTCRQHVMVAGQPAMPIQLMKSGKIETDTSAVQSPNPKQTPPPAPTKP